jgi:hypothetical protein
MVSIYTPKKDQRGPRWSEEWRKRRDEAQDRRLQRLIDKLNHEIFLAQMRALDI